MNRYLLPILLLLLAAPAAHAMRCGNRLVSDGAQDFQVRERCGEPFWTDRYTNIEIIGRNGPVEHQREVQFDVWYYNFGPHQLMRQLVFRDGLLERALGLGAAPAAWEALGDCRTGEGDFAGAATAYANALRSARGEATVELAPLLARGPLDTRPIAFEERSEHGVPRLPIA
jgi:hypothetical protein